MRVAVLAILLAAGVQAQEMTFTAQGRWLGLTLYAASTCNYSDQTVTLRGNTIWAAAQRQGLAPRTHVEILRLAQDGAKTSPAARAVLGLKIAALAISVAQATGAIGGEWGSGVKALAPGVAIVTEAVPRILSDAAPDAARVPDDYLPGLIEIPAGGCWVGSLIGDAQ